MPKIFRISMNDATFQALKEYIIAKHGVRHALSITIEEAVREFLERNKEHAGKNTYSIL